MKITRIGLALVALLAMGVVATSSQAEEHKHDHHAKADIPMHGSCVLKPTKDNKVRGRLRFVEKDGVTHITGRVTNLTPGEHGFHIHELGDISAPDGTSAGGHYNPGGHMHGGPDDDHSHVGDLGNITANADGVAEVKKVAKTKLHLVFGRSIVVHAGKDDLSSQPSGDAGPRVAVGVIGIAAKPMKKE